MTDVATLEQWMKETEGENLEFKSARGGFHFEELTKYGVALANEGGGNIILGVTDERPRQVCGTNAFTQPERTRSGLMQRLHLSIDFSEVAHANGRVLIFHIPSRPRGIPVQYDGRFWMRQGDSLVGMSGERLREIYSESGYDFSADICEGLTIDELDDQAIEDFKKRWIARTGNQQLASLTKQQLLSDIEVITDEGVTNAALILFGAREAVRKHLACAEFTFEYRSSNAAGPAAQREEFAEGFFLYFDKLWDLIDRRNDKQHYEDGPFILDVRTFQERIVREAILNAVSHRDYQLAGNNFMRQYSERIELDSPGGFSMGITPENILHRHSPRNRRIAEVFAKCGLVERAGQGVDLMYQLSIRDSKPKPDYSGSDDFLVCLRLNGKVLNKQFARFLLQCPVESLESLSTEQWLILDAVSREEHVGDSYLESIDKLLELKLVVRVSGGRFILPKVYYEFLGREASYSRLREREEKKETLEAHLEAHRLDGSAISDLQKVLPDKERKYIRRLLSELQDEDRIHSEGENRWTRYFAGPAGEGN